MGQSDPPHEVLDVFPVLIAHQPRPARRVAHVHEPARRRDLRRAERPGQRRQRAGREPRVGVQRGRDVLARLGQCRVEHSALAQLGQGEQEQPARRAAAPAPGLAARIAGGVRPQTVARDDFVVHPIGRAVAGDDDLQAHALLREHAVQRVEDAIPFVVRGDQHRQRRHGWHGVCLPPAACRPPPCLQSEPRRRDQQDVEPEFVGEITEGHPEQHRRVTRPKGGHAGHEQRAAHRHDHEEAHRRGTRGGHRSRPGNRDRAGQGGTEAHVVASAEYTSTAPQRPESHCVSPEIPALRVGCKRIRCALWIPPPCPQRKRSVSSALAAWARTWPAGWRKKAGR